MDRRTDKASYRIARPQLKIAHEGELFQNDRLSKELTDRPTREPKTMNKPNYRQTNLQKDELTYSGIVL